MSELAWRVLHLACRGSVRLSAAVLVLLALLGGLLLGPVGLVAIAVLAALGTFAATCCVRGQTGSWPAPGPIALRAVLAVSVLPAVRGLVALGAFAWLLLLVLGACGGIVRLHVVHERRLARSLRVVTTTPVDEPKLRTVVRGLPLGVLLRQWQVSTRDLHARPHLRRHRELVAVRGALLDEMERRDPRGFAAWLHASAQGLEGRFPPRAFLRP